MKCWLGFHKWLEAAWEHWDDQARHDFSYCDRCGLVRINPRAGYNPRQPLGEQVTVRNEET